MVIQGIKGHLLALTVPKTNICMANYLFHVLKQDTIYEDLPRDEFPAIDGLEWGLRIGKGAQGDVYEVRIFPGFELIN